MPNWLLQVYAISILLHFIIISFEFAKLITMIFVVYVSPFSAQMKRKLDRHETESAWNWRTQPISAQFNVNVIVLWESWLIAIVH